MQPIGSAQPRSSRLLLGIVVVALTAAILVARTHLMLAAFFVLLAGVALWARLGVDPDLLRERLNRDRTGEDPVRLAVIRLSFAALFVIGLLDVLRVHWSDTVPRALQGTALGLATAGHALILWSMTTNRFFVPVIRLQPERGHQVVSRGPYARVRHPGYAGMALAGPSMALAIGSWLALVPGVLLTSLFVARAAHEDRFLREHLEGYADYATRVRWRLLPGVW